MHPIVILALVIVFLAVGFLGLFCFTKPCRNWKIVAKARVLSKIRYIPALGFYLVVTLYIADVICSKRNFSDFDLAYLIAMIFTGFIWVWDHSKAEIAEEGIIIGRILKVCIPWDRFEDVKVDGNSIKVGRYVLTIEEGLNDLSEVLKS